MKKYGLYVVAMLAMAGMTVGSCVVLCSGPKTEGNAELYSIEAEMRSEGYMQSVYADVTVDACTVPVVMEKSSEADIEAYEHTWETETESETEQTTDELVWYEVDTPQTTEAFNLTEEECIMLQKLAYSEAGTEGAEVMAHIIMVVINRVNSDQFPNTISDVIFSPEQFGVIGNGSYYAAQPTEETMAALQLVQSGWDETYGATFFCSAGSVNDWHRNTLTYMYTYRDVMFWTYLMEH